MNTKRIKVIAAIGLAAILLVIVIPDGKDEAESVTDRGDSSLTVTQAKQSTIGSIESLQLEFLDPNEIGHAPPPLSRLDVMDLESIVNHDPFSMPGIRPAIGDANVLTPKQEYAAPQVQPQESIINVEKIQAVYHTDQGGMAVIDGKVVPVADPQRLIDLMQSKGN